VDAYTRDIWGAVWRLLMKERGGVPTAMSSTLLIDGCSGGSGSRGSFDNERKREESRLLAVRLELVEVLRQSLLSSRPVRYDRTRMLA
jgi:hypothetical protein